MIKGKNVFFWLPQKKYVFLAVGISLLIFAWYLYFTIFSIGPYSSTGNFSLNFRSLSPDGRYLDFDVWQKNSISFFELTSERISNYILDVDGRDFWKAGDFGRGDTPWSPDGKQIVYITGGASGSESGDRVMVLTLDGSRHEQIYVCPYRCDNPIWASDQKSILLEIRIPEVKYLSYLEIALDTFETTTYRQKPDRFADPPQPNCQFTDGNKKCNFPEGNVATLELEDKFLIIDTNSNDTILTADYGLFYRVPLLNINAHQGKILLRVVFIIGVIFCIPYLSKNKLEITIILLIMIFCLWFFGNCFLLYFIAGS